MRVYIRDVEPERGGWVIYWTWEPHDFRSAGRTRTDNPWAASLCREAKRLRAPVDLIVTKTSAFGGRLETVSMTGEARTA